MTAVPAVITIGIDPTIELGPITLAWHGLTIAIGIVIGGMAVAIDARRRGLDPERVYAIGMILVIGALVGGRAFYLLEHRELDDPGAWLGTTGFTFYGGFIAAALGIAYYIRRQRLSLSTSTRSPPACRSASPSAGSATSSTASTTAPRASSSSPSATPTPTRSPRTPTWPTTPAASSKFSSARSSSRSSGRCARAYTGRSR